MPHTHIHPEVVLPDLVNMKPQKSSLPSEPSVDPPSKKTLKLLSSKLLTKDLSPSVLKPIPTFSNLTLVESSIHHLVELLSIIVLPLLDMTTPPLHHMSSSKTLGVLLGVMKDISISLLKPVDLKVSVVSMKNHITLNIPHELIKSLFILYDMFRLFY
jgi:hypothetical protein